MYMQILNQYHFSTSFNEHGHGFDNDLFLSLSLFSKVYKLYIASLCHRYYVMYMYVYTVYSVVVFYAWHVWYLSNICNLL